MTFKRDNITDYSRITNTCPTMSLFRDGSKFFSIDIELLLLSDDDPLDPGPKLRRPDKDLEEWTFSLANIKKAEILGSISERGSKVHMFAMLLEVKVPRPRPCSQKSTNLHKHSSSSPAKECVRKTQSSSYQQLDFNVQGPITRSRGSDLNKLVSEKVVMGDFRSFQQQFETFLKMYEENRDRDRQEREQDRALMAAQQQALAGRLDELSRELSTGRPEGRAKAININVKQQKAVKIVLGGAMRGAHSGPDLEMTTLIILNLPGNWSETPGQLLNFQLRLETPRREGHLIHLRGARVFHGKGLGHHVQRHRDTVPGIVFRCFEFQSSRPSGTRAVGRRWRRRESGCVRPKRKTPTVLTLGPVVVDGEVGGERVRNYAKLLRTGYVAQASRDFN
ncbi:ATP-dependent protease La (LON) domain protein [Striga asiatica]|uniref:ATP-dependent protease La (LON) domain protein n=1 Tax=Striga asiatica TaxID=4170 RepID=A0A5A7QLC5_STRAF|nr:ATP-dependent protease La (LON) domain protein [Striga asiatica]